MSFSRIEAELARMKQGETKHVRVGKGREGLMTIKKGKKVEPLNIEEPKKKAKVIQGVRVITPGAM